MIKISPPLSVPGAAKLEYYNNWRLATRKTGRLMLMAGDQKIEHLNDDFYGPKIDIEDATPEHLFNIAARAKIGVFASHLGLIATYGADFKKIPYLVKLNGKTNLIPTAQADPASGLLNSVTDVVDFKKTSRLNIVGVGYTLYPGSMAEPEMLAEAGRIVWEAHRHGLLAVLWIYPRGRAVKKERDSHLAAGMAGLGAALGADFIKLTYPQAMTPHKQGEIVLAAGKSGVIFSGGEQAEVKKFLSTLATQIKYGARGNATGRNIHQRDLKEAVNFCNAISAVSLYNYSAAAAYDIYRGKAKAKF